MSRYIAERRLWFSEKKGGVRKKLLVGVGAPMVVTQDEVKYPVDGVMSKCHVEFEGMNEHSFDVFGADSLQAINLASNIEAVIERLSDKYDFYWDTGEPYFDDAS